MSSQDWERMKPGPPMPPPGSFEELCKVYGDPRLYMRDDGRIIDGVWSSLILGQATLPWGLTIPWAGSVVARISVHRLLVAEVEAVFRALQAMSLQDQVREFGGAYNFRQQRGGAKLSVHCWGAALDLNTSTNKLGEPHVTHGGKADMDLRVVKVFEDRGWGWGGHWNRPDCQHFQWCSLGY